MSDHLDDLERLARMRSDGTLTEDEFQVEKAKVLSAQLTSHDSNPLAAGHHGSHETRNQSHSYLKVVGIALLVCVPIVLAAAWWRLDQRTPESVVATDPTESSTMGARALTDQWVVGNWAFSDSCETDNMIVFGPDGTYEIPGIQEGNYSTDGTSISFVDSTTLPELGDVGYFEPEMVDDAVVPAAVIDENSMTLNGSKALRC